MTLKIKDRKIIKELDQNPKILVSKLAKKVRLSQQVVDYHIKKLAEKKIISNFGTVINFAKLGLQQYRVLFTLGQITGEKKREILDYLKSHKSIYWSAIVGSKWDLFVVFLAENYEEFQGILDEMFKKFPKLLKDYDALYTLYQEFYTHEFLYPKSKQSDVVKINFSKENDVVKLDQLDWSILKEINSNSRLSSLEVGKRCNTSYKTVQSRVKRMEADGIIEGRRLFLKTEEYGYKAYLLLISFNSYGRVLEKEMLSYAKEQKNITQVLKLFGGWSLMFHLRVKEYEDLQKIIVEMRNKYPIIGNYEVIPIFEDVRINLLPI